MTRMARPSSHLGGRVAAFVAAAVLAWGAVAIGPAAMAAGATDTKPAEPRPEITAPAPVPAALGFAVQERGRACEGLLVRDPDAAGAFARKWADEGGGAPAHSCAARALLLQAQGLPAGPDSRARYGEAAALFEELGVVLALPADRVTALREAGRAYYLAGRHDRALRALQLAQNELPDEVSIMLDRVGVLVAMGNGKPALDLLDQAVRLGGETIPVLMLRSRAYRALGWADLAGVEVERALAMSPFDPAALLERGLVRQAQGNTDAARVDWGMVVRVAPASAPGRRAQDLLAEATKQK